MKTITNLIGLLSLFIGTVSVFIGMINSNVVTVLGGGFFMALGTAISVCNKSFNEDK